MFEKRFSLAHWDNHPNHEDFYNAFKSSAPEYKKEIRDIYFGSEFIYNYKGEDKRYGEIMGVTATQKQFEQLLRLQDDCGIECSLTVNSLNIPREIASDPDVTQQFVDYIKVYYDLGVRSCTISNTHLMKLGVLQSEFPEMLWKNTVNHQVKTTQEVYDYAALGYNTILFDRSLNRDSDLLKEMYREAKKIGCEVSLLASESCLPSCPFKREHDSWQEELQKSDSNYWQTFSQTCTKWRGVGGRLPRLGTDMSMATKELVDLFMANTDVMKFSGRISPSVEMKNIRMCWSGAASKKVGVLGPHDMSPKEFEFADCFEEIYEKELAPYIVDRWLPMGWTYINNITKNQHAQEDIELIWATPKGRGLSKILSTCKNRCWDCHACEKVFGVEPFNSALEL